MRFTQFIEVQGADGQALADHISDWHRDQSGVAPGYLGARLLADTDQSGRHVIEVTFASEQQAQENNTRAETAQWAEVLQGLGTVAGDAYRNLREVVTTSDLT